MANYESRLSKVYLAQFDLTADTIELSTALERDVLDTTCFGDASRTFIAGNHDNKMTWNGLYEDTATLGSEAVLTTLRDKSDPQVITVWHGDTVLGNQGYGTNQGWMTAPEVSSRVGDRIVMSAALNLSKMDRIKSLGPKQTATATTNGTSINDGTASSAGGAFFYHVIAITGTWTLDLEESDDNASSDAFAAKATSGALTAVAGGRVSFSGAVEQYVRLKLTENVSGSITMIAGYLRS